VTVFELVELVEAGLSLASCASSESVFPSRVADSRDQLVEINNRIFMAQAKIDRLRSASSKAARVFSSPKYPAPNKLASYNTIYRDVHPRLQKVREEEVVVLPKHVTLRPGRVG